MTNNKYIAKSVEVSKLILDKNNPRFAELYSGSEDENDIIDYLLYTESANDLAKAIQKAGEFYEDRPLWVYKSGGRYIVKDGNRRCAAIKALQEPKKYGLDLKGFKVTNLPVLEYFNLEDVESRIREEHTSNLFKGWGRIAKALDIYRVYRLEKSFDNLYDIDSKPKDFLKIASFYHEATKISGEDFKKLVREGKGKKGGKTIIFERMFAVRTQCGYSFKNKDGVIDVHHEELFTSYIKTLVAYLVDHPNTTSRYIDKSGTTAFLEELKDYGFSKKSSKQDDSKQDDSKQDDSKQDDSKQDDSKQDDLKQDDSKQDDSKQTSNSNTRHSVKTKPQLKRKKIPPTLKKLIDECYSLKEDEFANAKAALTRVTLECTLKYTIENTHKPNNRAIKESNHFRNAYYNNKNNNPLTYVDYDLLKKQFIKLITNTGVRKAFENFDLERPHQIIHNYHVTATPADAKSLCDNLMILLEFMLQDESDLIKSLDMSKL